jgi:hypothetical protein
MLVHEEYDSIWKDGGVRAAVCLGCSLFWAFGVGVAVCVAIAYMLGFKFESE